MLVILLMTLPVEPTDWLPGPAPDHFARREPPAVGDEAGVPQFTLPSILPEHDRREHGGLTPERWAHRREEVVDVLRREMFGTVPGDLSTRFEVSPAERGTLGDGVATVYRKITTTVVGPRGTSSFDAHVFAPASPEGRPCYLLIDNRGQVDDNPDVGPESEGFWPVEQILSAGYATVAFRNGDVDPDTNNFTDGIHALSAESFEGQWTSLAAWAWGAGRVLDALADCPEVDQTRTLVVGHSRGGKTALWAGASDERFAGAISNESGCGGAALSRRRFGERLIHINTRFPHWFTSQFKTYNEREDALPFDQHWLLAATAPRGVYVASAGGDLWADPRGERIALQEASRVWEALGHHALPDRPLRVDDPAHTPRLGHHLRAGKHNLTAGDWRHFLNWADGIDWN